MNQFTQNNTAGMQQMHAGAYGHEFITSATDFTGKRFCWIEATEETVVSYKDYNPEGYFGQKTDVTMKEGEYTGGDLREISVTSGRLKAYMQAGQRTSNDS